MRLSDIKGERVFDVIADIIEPICNIAADEEAVAVFTAKQPEEGQTPQQAFIERLRKHLPKLCKGHKDDLVTIFATLNGVSKDQYLKSVTMTSLVEDIFEIMTDEDFLGFLS